MWVKFLKDYQNPKDDKKFATNAVIELDDPVAKSLIDLGFAEKTDCVQTDLSKKMDEFTKQLSDKVEDVVKTTLDNLTKKVKGIEIIPLGNNLGDMGGFKSTGEFVVSVIKACKPTNPEVDNRLIELNKTYSALSKAPSGQNTMDDAEGGFLIPKPIADGIWSNVAENEEIFGRTDQRQTSGNSLKIKRQPEVSRKDGYRHAGMVAYWLPEAEQYTSSSMRWGEMELRLNKITALAYATDEEIADAAIALGPLFDKRAGEAIMFRVNEAIITGTGAGMPLGILNSPALITVPLIANQEERTIMHQNINKIFYTMHPKHRSRAVWFVHPNLEEQLNFISFTDDTVNKRPIYMPPSGLSTAPYGTLMGRPVIPLEYLYDFGQRGDILFADLSQYVTLRKAGGDGGIKQATSIHVRFLFDETAFKFSFRVDGQPLWSSPVEDYRGTTQRGPFVTLANRSGGSSSSGL
jgi:HK97 family phage major capsid protein